MTWVSSRILGLWLSTGGGTWLWSRFGIWCACLWEEYNPLLIATIQITMIILYKFLQQTYKNCNNYSNYFSARHCWWIITRMATTRAAIHTFRYALNIAVSIV